MGEIGLKALKERQNLDVQNQGCLKLNECSMDWIQPADEYGISTVFFKKPEFEQFGWRSIF